MAEIKEMPVEYKAIPIRPPKRRKITLADVEAIAELAAKRLNDTEACGVLGIIPSTWIKWKCRDVNQAIFASVLARVRGNRIKAHLSNIETKSDKDWRASQAYLEMTEPDRYGKQAGSTTVNVGVSIGDQTLAASLSRVFTSVEPSESKARIARISETNVQQLACATNTQCETESEPIASTVPTPIEPLL